MATAYANNAVYGNSDAGFMLDINYDSIVDPPLSPTPGDMSKDWQRVSDMYPNYTSAMHISPDILGLASFAARHYPIAGIRISDLSKSDLARFDSGMHTFGLSPDDHANPKSHHKVDFSTAENREAWGEIMMGFVRDHYKCMSPARRPTHVYLDNCVILHERNYAGGMSYVPWGHGAHWVNMQKFLSLFKVRLFKELGIRLVTNTNISPYFCRNKTFYPEMYREGIWREIGLGTTCEMPFHKNFCITKKQRLLDEISVLRGWAGAGDYIYVAIPGVSHSSTIVNSGVSQGEIVRNPWDYDCENRLQAALLMMAVNAGYNHSIFQSTVYWKQIIDNPSLGGWKVKDWHRWPEEFGDPLEEMEFITFIPDGASARSGEPFPDFVNVDDMVISRRFENKTLVVDLTASHSHILSTRENAVKILDT